MERWRKQESHRIAKNTCSKLNISCTNAQKDLKISTSQVQVLVELVLENLEVKCDEISIHFVEKKVISRLHLTHFNDPSSTDCISFPMDTPSIESELPIILGDVFVCPHTAIAYALKNNTSPYLEVSLYIIHGILHLLGFKDIKKEDKAKMRAQEKRCLCYLKEKKAFLCPY